MYKTLFPDFDDQAKIWIYGIYRQITDQDKMTIKNYLEGNWPKIIEILKGLNLTAD